ncbi:MAG: RHS repeat-associated core domain-containing protein [Clostridiales bacterium]|jgi:RHS repeat-associated protein|nr:RHS repeat-associated core domain-containing protein [Clostridiales bacterium]
MACVCKHSSGWRNEYNSAETGFYLAGARYYDLIVGRWISPDGEVSDIDGPILSNNLYNYCMNNPVNMDDPTGQWPKWLSGALNVVSGALQVAAGAALGATVGWTGVVRQ